MVEISYRKKCFLNDLVNLKTIAYLSLLSVTSKMFHR